jgi:hypothetical protein
MSDYALKNIFSTVQKLNVDHVFVTYKPETVKSFYRAMVKGGGEFCSTCTSGINYAISLYQRLFNIPLVIFGTSTRVDEQSPFEVTCTHPAYVRKVLLESGLSLRDIDAFLIKRQSEVPTFEKIRMKLFDLDSLTISLPDYVRWDNQEIQNILERDLNWTTPDKEKDHIDCKFAPIKYYLKNKQIPHYIFKQEKYSQLIRDGQMTREKALESLSAALQGEHEEPAELNDFMQFLGLEKKDIENKEKKSHLNYITKTDCDVNENLVFKLFSIPWKIYKYMQQGAHSKKF